ncbi:MAG TPA: radical SAM/SPASM domain-containing protein [Candidatus Ozemobacteraceae bacterium]
MTSNSEQGNLNFHSSGHSVFDASLQDAAFAEYRRQWRDNPINAVVAPFPLHLDIESTSACNLRCPHCAATHEGWGPHARGFISMELFRKLIDEAAREGVYCIKFSLRGEPLIHPHLVDMVRMVRKAGILDCYFNTNAMLLTEEISTALIEAGLPRISISIDGWDAKSYSQYRPGADYSLVCKNIETLLRIRTRLKSTTPKIRIQTVMLPEMNLHWESYKEYWRKFADEVGYLDARDEGPGVNHRGKTGKFKCPFLWQRLTVLWDGTVLSCLAHGVEDLKPLTLGNAATDSLKSLWHSEAEKHLRKLHISGESHQNAGCDCCSYRALEMSKEGRAR